MRTESVVIRHNNMSMQRFCDQLLEEAMVIPDEKVGDTNIRAKVNEAGEVEVYLEY